MLFFFVFACFSWTNSINILTPLNSCNDNGPLYRVNKTAKIYVISNSSQEVLQMLTVQTEKGRQNASAFTLSVPQTDGSLTPLIPVQDNDILSISINGVNNASGWLYINSVTQNLNVFPLIKNSLINFKQGTNVFFRLYNPVNQIPVAQNVVIDKNQDLSGFANLPGQSDSRQFFDSASIDGVDRYDQLELPLETFHFTSKSANVKYEIKFSTRRGMAIGSSGLLMTNDFPSGGFASGDYNLDNQNFPSGGNVVVEYDLNNQDGINVNATLVTRFDKTRQYGGNIGLEMKTMAPVQFRINSSDGDSNIASHNPVNRIVIVFEGPYAIQYFLKATLIPTTLPPPLENEMDTQSSSIPRVIVSLLAAALFRF